MARKAIWSLFSTSKKPHSSSSSPHLLSLPSPHTPLSSLTWTLSDSMIQETIEDAQSAIAKWYPESLPLFHGNRAESVQFLNSIRQLDQAMRVLAASGPGSGSNPDRLVTAQNLMLTAMKRLERDFHMVLSSNLGGLDPESISSHYSSSSSSSESGGSLDGRTISEAAMYGLKLIADCMVASGYGRECAQVYKAVRRSIVHEGLNRLGIERLRTSHVQKMDARALDRTVKSWIGSVRTAVRALFRGERILCDHVFSSSDSVRESCFKDITREAAVSLFHLPGLVVSAKRPPPPQGCCDLIHQLLDLYDALWEIWPDVETLFNFESTWDVRLQAIQSLVKLGGAIHGIISDYESGVQKDTSKALAPGGGIHPLTSSAMDFLASLTRHAGTLSEILLVHSKPGGFSLPEEERSETLSGSALSLCLARVILTLLCKLDSKARLYRDASLSYLFMANNLDYIVRKVGSTDLKYLLGEEWVSGKENKVRQFATSYEVFAWGMVFLSLPETATSGGGGGGSISDDIVKEWFVKFNAAFEEAYVKQVSWVLPDRRLRELVKASLTNKILPAYRDLYELGIEWLGESNRFSGTVIRFTPDDVTSYLSELFRGDYSPPLLRDERVIDQCSTTDHFKTMRVDRDCQLC